MHIAVCMIREAQQKLPLASDVEKVRGWTLSAT